FDCRRSGGGKVSASLAVHPVPSPGQLPAPRGGIHLLRRGDELPSGDPVAPRLLSDRGKRGEPQDPREGGREAWVTGREAGIVAAPAPGPAGRSGRRPGLEGPGTLRTSTADPRRRDAPRAQGESGPTGVGRLRGPPLDSPRDPGSSRSPRTTARW